MKRLLTVVLAVCAVVGVMASTGSAADPAPPFAQCPAVGADSSCALLIRVTPTGQVGVYGDPSQGPFDGVEDTLIGVQNDSRVAIASIPIASTTGKDLFGFDGDGLCTYLLNPTCLLIGTTGYEGPGVSFTGISTDLTAGTVNFSPAIPPGGSAYFSLEEALATVPPFDIDPGPPAPADSYVALGDSYSAGEGLLPYRSGTDTATDSCHRSDRAHGPLLEADKPVLGTFTFAACSGAVTAWFFDPNPGNKEPRQLDSLTAGTTTVTLTIGGNDVGFVPVVKSCLFGREGIFSIPFSVFGKQFTGHSGCRNDTTINNVVQARLDALDGLVNTASPDKTDVKSLQSILLAIHQRSPNAKIYLAGYPLLFGTFKGECGVGNLDPQGLNTSGGIVHSAAIKITAEDAAWINDLGIKLNQVIRRAVTRAVAAGVSASFVNVSPYFDGHRLCDTGTTWINPVIGPQADNSNSFPAGRGSFHPTVDGQKAYEQAFIAAGVGN